MPQVDLAMLIPIAAIVLGIGVAFWAIYWDHRTKQLIHHERRLMIEKGITPPPLIPEKKALTPEDCLRRGVIMLFLGIGLGIGYFVLLNTFPDSTGFGHHMEGPPAWICGIGGAIVGLLGIGYIVYYLIARKQFPEGTERGAK